MKTFRRHWRTVSLVAAISFLAGAWFWHRAEGRSAMMLMLDDPPGEQGYASITGVQHDKILRMLKDLSLDTDALTALNTNSSQAESIVSAARSWLLSNEGNVDTLQAAISQKVVAIRQLEQAIAIGPYDAERGPALALAREDLVTAQANYRSALATLESTEQALLSESQRTTWTAIKTGHGQSMPLRMLDLNDSQRLALSDARIRYERQIAAASSANEREAAISTYQTALDAILTQGQKGVVQAFGGYVASSSAAVIEAYKTVLPVASNG